MSIDVPRAHLYALDDVRGTEVLIYLPPELLEYPKVFMTVQHRVVRGVYSVPDDPFFPGAHAFSALVFVYIPPPPAAPSLRTQVLVGPDAPANDRVGGRREGGFEVAWDALFGPSIIPGARLVGSIHQWTSNVVTL